MMVQKNIELELQALRLIQERNGVIPESLTPTKDQHYSQVVAEDEDEKILQEVLRKSKEEYEAEQSKKKKGGYDTDMEKALAYSQDEQSRLHADRQREQEMLDKALKLSLTSSSTTKSQASLKGLPGIPKDTKSSSKSSPSKSPAPAVPVIKEPVAAKVPTKAPNKVSSAEAAASWLSSAKAEAAEQQTSSRTTALASSDAAELKRREDYLRLQRDKLLAMKKQEREKTLDSFAASSQGRERPRSARAAKQATQGEGKPKAAPISAEDQKKLAMRQALAARLKEEVINKK
ncbi:cilia- and flagella-associated protein 36-like isoform X2 [Saccoglossus kowalevskii]|uniref:Coiled-coil domain-containing protein 104-like isoform X2 n=1 Tax=Saccoglossus kowalevskii TaxID=10224 RepID=A0ABM0LWQ8_SACKO|nr:PREDICTED: coiled-coil domain-containing protein 104-like isoform X2 [Saccoglossus kowalevskii]